MVKTLVLYQLDQAIWYLQSGVLLRDFMPLSYTFPLVHAALDRANM
jgi:hypothetical protein